ncbi:STAS-like domain-containing protein [Pseudomonas sp. CG7]|uniref:STAS-like domain-containing protein n=1 Tax=Pseudomonas sp. CG7 TaxID=191007 RepID=UPI0020346870|nr:STAS-like domain-containing protein [Pseudomonas sp. CG7]MCM2461048.1 STAS-like domain-containing protein [Pseudomonas sp. CG7]
MNKFNIATEFSRYPAGRYISDGPFSGEQFRDEYLVKILDAGKPTIIILDGARGYGSSFLEEAFGGLVRKGYTAEKILSLINFESRDASLIYEINDYIKTAIPEDK